ELAERVTGYHVHRGALASMQRKPLPAADELLATARRVVVMESVNDHTNIGAIFRSAAALGMDAVLLSPDCADPLYRRSVKVSMGAVFSVPYARLEAWPKGLEAVREAGFRLLALTPDAKATSIDEAAPHRLERVALMLGAEGDGLST
ncbi:RNA methyltransferase, partial [Streptomyces sp. SID7982]|nr:RNA methyltransferase [Streptomyces sp. SID7982]